MVMQHHPSNESPLTKYKVSLPDEVGAVPTKLSYEITLHYWVNAEKGRYYAARLLINLFGQWELEQAWGSLSSRRGRHRYVPLVSQADGLTKLRIVSARRRQRGYIIQ